jgi:type IV pilus assembly protein PilN
MIRINLLPKKEIKKRAALLEQGVVAGVAVFVVLAGLLLFYMHAQGKVEALEQDIAKTKLELKELEKKKAQIEEYKAAELVVQRKIDVIKKLEQQKSGPVLMLDEIAKVLPPKMWLTQLKSQGSSLTMEGIAIDNETIAEFMTKLEATSQFSNIELQVSQETKIQDYELKKFTVSSVLRVMKEFEDLEKEAQTKAPAKAPAKAPVPEPAK